jgi:threonine/homoserine/homoserine lactone efflux protein
VVVTLLYGIIIGVALAFVFGYGASFFSMMQTGAHYGFHKTLPMVYGIVLGDAIRVALLVGVFANIVGLDTIAEILKRPWVLIIGCAVLIAIGIYTMTRKLQRSGIKGSAVKYECIDTPQWPAIFGHGFALNFLNPLAWFFWLTVVIVVSPLFDNAPTARIYVFFSGVLIAGLGCNILKCWLSSQLQRLLSVRFMNIFNKTVGLILIGFALYILFAMVIFRDRTPEPDTQRATTVIMGVIPPEMLQDSGTAHLTDTIKTVQP